MGERSPGRLNRGPYRVRAVPSTVDHGRPSSVLAENIRCYRVLRGMTQEQLAARMTVLGHAWSRSIVSAIEGKKRSVTIDELFGLAINFGVTVGGLLDPSGPDGSRDLGLDVGLGSVGHNALPTQFARLLAASRAVIRLVGGEGILIDIDVASGAETASPHDPDDLGTNVGAPVPEGLGTHPTA